MEKYFSMNSPVLPRALPTPVLATRKAMLALALLTHINLATAQGVETLPSPTPPVVATAPSTEPTDPAVILDATAAPKLEAPIPVLRQTADADLWGRIRNGYRMPDLQTELVTSQEQWYASRASYISRMTERSNKYLYHIVEELERRNMPTELALLPFIESAFNPQAVSSAKAAGMWQFMPATGKHFALKQNVFRDDRRDVLQSTRAALDYLQKLYGMFGDWHLALAAYNWGEGSVGRAIAKNQREGLGTSYLDLNMPNETRNYVPKLQAVKNIVMSPQAYNAQLPTIPNHPYFQSVPISRDLDVALAAKLAEIKIDDFKQLNPSANKPVIFKAGTPYILLPWDNAGTFERNLASYSGPTSGWTVWTAPSTLKVADAARRVGMSEQQMREINRIPPRMLIKTGSTLLVPRGGAQQKDVSEQVADNGQVSFAPEIVLVKQWVKLRKAETVASLAKRYGVSAASVAGWNKVSANGSFKPKQKVVLYLPKKAKSAKGGRSAKGGKVIQGQTRKSNKAFKANTPRDKATVVKKKRK
jgi:membrane-bound lytic murein transglycosylase D